jgi:hypothetical protein
MGNVDQRHGKAWRTYALSMRTSAGLSAMKLLGARDSLNPDPIEDHETGPWESMLNIELRRALVRMHPLSVALFGPQQRDPFERSQLAASVDALKREARHLHE